MIFRCAPYENMVSLYLYLSLSLSLSLSSLFHFLVRGEEADEAQGSPKVARAEGEEGQQQVRQGGAGGGAALNVLLFWVNFAAFQKWALDGARLSPQPKPYEPEESALSPTKPLPPRSPTP